ncbi:MAG: type II toxin-antitoxin system RelE/ParE family toxin [Bacteroidetes bacterium]|nr:type II toxin-antitoxin system RelE/ParE family toxin [Bacteroidota bacterium]
MSKPLPFFVAASFRKNLMEIYNYILPNSTEAAENFVDGINKILPEIAKYPTAYPSERRLPTKRNLYRFRNYKRNYKIIFKVLKSKTVFVAITFSGRSDEAYKQFRTAKY